MRKTAWPWIGTTELEMGSMSPDGSATDIVQDPSEPYDSLVAEKFTTDNEIPHMTFSEGVMSPVQDTFSDLEETEQIGILSFAKKYLKNVTSSSNLLLIGFSDGLGDSLVSRGANVTSLVKGSSFLSEKANVKIGDSRFYSFGQKFNSFCIASDHIKSSNFNIEISNIKRHLRPTSSGLIIARSSFDHQDILKAHGFKVVKKNIGKISCYLVNRDIKSKHAIVRCYSKESGLASAFECDIAKTAKEMSDGLQVYPSLGKSSGLLFQYEKPKDVMFHMGSVGYPIDIIFIDKNDKIKKINKNIEPGSIETFGCSDVKTVLEISGGLSDALGISVGSYTSIVTGSDFEEPAFIKAAEIKRYLEDDNLFVKKSNSLKTGFYKYSSANIFVLNNKDKNIKTSDIIDYINLKDYPKNKKTIAFDIDQLLIEDKAVELYRHARPNGYIYRGLDNQTFSILEDSRITVKLSQLLEQGFGDRIFEKYSFACSPNKSFKLMNCSDRLRSLEKLARFFRDKDIRVVFVTKTAYNESLLKKILQSEINIKIAQPTVVDFETILVPDEFGHKESYFALQQRYPDADVSMHVSSLIKSAGVPVPDSVKQKAKKAIDFFDRADNSCRKIIDNLKKNLSEYEKIQAQADGIAGTKGQYKQSVKRNSRIIKRALLNIKEGIKILNNIRDVSTTSEVIDSIATAAKIASGSISDVFVLLDVIDSPDFFGQLQEKTGAMENLVEDLKMSLSRAREYVNSDILGILIISE